MSDIVTKRIDELPAATGVGDSDLFVVEQSGVAKSVEGSVLRSNFSQEVDSTLSSTSENPVQNKVVKAALDGKANNADIHNLPSGGTAGQFLVKQSATDYDAAWVTVPNANGVSF
jgi:hypothetical protein